MAGLHTGSVSRMGLNAAWHAEHPMAKNATSEQRVQWHTEHLRRCGCRQPPPDIMALIEHTPPPCTEPGQA